MAKAQDSLPLKEGPDRVRYATGVLLEAEDFQAEQDYHRSRLARVLAYAMGHGTLSGLEVTHEPGQPEDADNPARSERLLVAPGLAIDRLGRMIEVVKPRCLKLDPLRDQPRALNLQGYRCHDLLRLDYEADLIAVDLDTPGSSKPNFNRTFLVQRQSNACSVVWTDNASAVDLPSK